MQEGKGFGFLFEMGTGKSLTSIAVVGAGYKLGKISRVLVVAPTSVCAVWPREFADYADFPFDIRVLLGTKTRRLKMLQELTSESDALKVAVINYESVWRDGIKEALLAWDPDMVICDESQRIKDPKAKQSKALHKLGDKARYKLILSGTPLQSNAIDLYSQYRFLDPSIFGTRYTAFRDRYAVMGGWENKKIVGYKNMDDLIQKEHSIAYRIKKRDCLDLPGQVFIDQYVEMGNREFQTYKKLQKDSFAELSEGTINAPTVLAKLLRLRQFTGGYLVPDGGTEPELVFDGKLKTLADIIDDHVLSSGKKIVVFAEFRVEIKAICDMLARKKVKHVMISGDVKQEERGRLVEAFQGDEETKVFVAQLDTAGLGITLTAADTCVYYSLNFNYASYTQSLARIHRIGQKNKCTYIHLIVPDTIDEKILFALAKKEDISKSLVDNWKKYFMDNYKEED